MTKARKPSYPRSSPEAGASVKGVVAPCKGWIQIHSHYLDHHIQAHNDIAVGYTAELYKMEGETSSLIEKVVVDYESLKTEKAAAGGDTPEAAAKNGNPKVNLGGEHGYDSGRYKLTLTPKIAPGKLRLQSEPQKDGTYVILDTDGAASKEVTDPYVQVPSTTAVKRNWSETFDLRCCPITAPKVVRFVWADFKTWDAITTARITGDGNLSQPGIEASEGCIKTIAANMIAALGENWRQVAVANAFFPLDPRIRYWAFVLINKTEELLARRVRITNPGRSAAYQTFLHERHVQCKGPVAAAAWHSNHQYGLAFDTGYSATMTAAPQSSEDVQVLVADAIGLDWGGRWSKPDYPHFEYSGATSKVDSYHDQIAGKSPTTLTYGGHQYVQSP